VVRQEYCPRCRTQVAMKRYRCPRCGCGTTRPVWGWDCPHGAPRCFTDWCPSYREEMAPAVSANHQA